ncbi:mannose-1-phosphate guanylyltransferase [soil metagenome]
MIVVIIAGGSGSRLWPLSTPGYPKHLLTIGKDKSSLLQNTYARAKKLGNEVYIVSEASHIEHVKEQLSDLADDHFIVEPARRGTANCIITALVHIGKTHDADEPIAFIHADHYIRDIAGFQHSFRIANKMAKQHGRIVLIGVEPDEPATGFGYIQKADILDEELFVYGVDSFKEKPDFRTAQAYLRSGKYLWNCGYFVGSIQTFKEKMQAYAPDLLTNYNHLAEASDEAYADAYLALTNDAIDYALIEKVQDLLVVPAGFDWMDLGSFADISKVTDADENGNYVRGNVAVEEVNNSYVENQEDKPVAVIGLDNCVVINTPHGILVTRKDLSQKVGDVSKQLNK